MGDYLDFLTAIPCWKYCSNFIDVFELLFSSLHDMPLLLAEFLLGLGLFVKLQCVELVKEMHTSIHCYLAEDDRNYF